LLQYVQKTGNIFFFGRINKYKMELSDIGRIAFKYWQEIPNHFPFVRLDNFVIMPDHLHGIIKIRNPDVSTGMLHISYCI